MDPLNGVNLMPADIFVCVSRYTVPFAERESFEDGEAAATTTFHTNMGGGGFLGFLMLRHLDRVGYNYASLSVFKDQRWYQKFRAAENKLRTDEAGQPERIFYEGVLVLERGNVLASQAALASEDKGKKAKKKPWLAIDGDTGKTTGKKAGKKKCKDGKRRLEVDGLDAAAAASQEQASSREISLETADECEWSLELPEFPSLDRMLELLPFSSQRLVPWSPWGWERWQELRSIEESEQVPPEAYQEVSSHQLRARTSMVLGGATGGASMALLLFVSALRKRRSRRGPKVVEGQSASSFA